ncbi:MAG TPA: ABC transporter permease [Streptosporangiaceae bacterium]
MFTWLNPLGYLSSRIVRPIGLAISFAALSSYYGDSVTRPLVGASLLAGAHAVIYGMSMSVSNERAFGTLEGWLASPQNILGGICQRALPHLADGFVSGSLTYLVCCALFGALPVALPEFAALLLLALVSSFGLGLVMAGIALRATDAFFWPNLANLALMLFAGVLVSARGLPAPLRPVGSALPLSHLMTFVTGQGGGALRCTGAELTVAACWCAAGAVTISIALARRGSRPAGAIP